MLVGDSRETILRGLKWIFKHDRSCETYITYHDSYSSSDSKSRTSGLNKKNHHRRLILNQNRVTNKNHISYQIGIAVWILNQGH
jgi:hypothetical protein